MKDTRPNVLWICSDQQRWDTLGCYGNPFVHTPNLDRLATGAALFEHAYCQSPVCTPSRGSFLTGRYPRTTRLRQNGQDISPDEVPVTRLLAEAGYVCGLAGKLHLSACSPKLQRKAEPRIQDGYTEFYWNHHPYADIPHGDYFRWLDERAAKIRSAPHPHCACIRLGTDPAVHQTTWCAEKAIEFIQAHSADGRPWLFSMNTFDPHHPFDPPAEYLERYAKLIDDLPAPNYVDGELEHKGAYQRCDHAGAYANRNNMPYDRMSAADHRWVRAAYWAMCDLLDVQVERVLSALERSGQADNTIVIYSSDHGEMLGDHGIYWKGPYFYEPAIRVPLIISWPGHIRAQRIRGLAELVDLAPTLLEAAGLPRHPGMQGNSMLPALTQADADTSTWREDVYCECYNMAKGYTQAIGVRPYLTMLRTGRHKLVVDHSGTGGELYDLQSDACETHNRWDDPSLKDIKLELLQRLCNRMAFTADPLPQRLAPW